MAVRVELPGEWDGEQKKEIGQPPVIHEDADAMEHDDGALLVLKANNNGVVGSAEVTHIYAGGEWESGHVVPRS